MFEFSSECWYTLCKGDKMNKKGFTIVEVLFVVAIIGILTTVTVVVIQNTKNRASDAIIEQEKKELDTALRILGIDLNDYESSIYNCKDTSWVESKCHLNESTGKWQWVKVSVEDLKRQGYLKDTSSRCSGDMTLYNGNDDVLPEVTAECN